MTKCSDGLGEGGQRKGSRDSELASEVRKLFYRHNWPHDGPLARHLLVGLVVRWVRGDILAIAETVEELIDSGVVRQLESGRFVLVEGEASESPPPEAVG